MSNEQIYGFMPFKYADRPAETMIGETVYDYNGKVLGWIVSGQAVAAWNTRANDNLTAESGVSDKHMDANDVIMAQADSREKLEKDAFELASYLLYANYDGVDDIPVNEGEKREIRELLDRQAAITERELLEKANPALVYVGARMNGKTLINKLQQQVDNLTAEIGVSDKHVDANDGSMAQADSRGRLEADVRSLFKYQTLSADLSNYVIGLLDRQAAITRAEVFEDGEFDCMTCGAKRELQDRIAELTAECDELREELEDEKSENGWARDFLNRMGPKCGTADCPSLVAYVNNLEAERDVLRERLDAMKAVLDKWVKPTVGVEPPEHPMVQLQPNDGDSRERLEADIMATDYLFVHTPMGFRDIRSWLDRQAAITERETVKQWEEQASELVCKVNELTAERDLWLRRYQQAHDYALELTAERDELRAKIEDKRHPFADVILESLDSRKNELKLKERVGELEAERDELRQLLEDQECGAPKRNRCGTCRLPELEVELAGKLEEKQHVSDVQRDSFLKMERDLADANERIGELERTIENLRGD